jgi:DNA-binding HxlR family transcriptional regulator
VLILRELADAKSLRFTVLKRAIGDISQRVLAQTLRRLEQDGYVTRTVFPTIPPRVDYALTPLGRSLWQSVTPLIAWAHANQKKVKAARAVYVAPAALVAL